MGFRVEGALGSKVRVKNLGFRLPGFFAGEAAT